jgi:hypothetical protein
MPTQVPPDNWWNRGIFADLSCGCWISNNEIRIFLQGVKEWKQDLNRSNKQSNFPWKMSSASGDERKVNMASDWWWWINGTPAYNEQEDASIWKFNCWKLLFHIYLMSHKYSKISQFSKHNNDIVYQIAKIICDVIHAWCNNFSLSARRGILFNHTTGIHHFVVKNWFQNQHYAWLLQSSKLRSFCFNRQFNLG